MHAGASRNSLGEFFGRFFFVSGADVLQEPVQDLSVALAWGVCLGKPAGSCRNRIARRKSIIRSVQKNATRLEALPEGVADVSRPDSVSEVAIRRSYAAGLAADCPWKYSMGAPRCWRIRSDSLLFDQTRFTRGNALDFLLGIKEVKITIRGKSICVESLRKAWPRVSFQISRLARSYASKNRHPQRQILSTRGTSRV